MRTTQKKPPMLTLLLGLIGEEATQCLINAFGGVEITIPKGETGRGGKRFSAISGVIGEEAARLLCKHFERSVIYIPKNMAKVRNERNRRIVAAYDRGANVDKLTEEFGLSERQIRNILKQTDMTTVSCQG